MSESVLAASDFSLETSWKQAEKGTLSPLECLSFANTIQADLPTCGIWYNDYLLYFLPQFQFKGARQSKLTNLVNSLITKKSPISSESHLTGNIQMQQQYFVNFSSPTKYNLVRLSTSLLRVWNVSTKGGWFFPTNSKQNKNFLIFKNSTYLSWFFGAFLLDEGS